MVFLQRFRIPIQREQDIAQLQTHVGRIQAEINGALEKFQGCLVVPAMLFRYRSIQKRNRQAGH
ncbi:hypothetical protein D3C83_128210 [compost metagenome]